jgi:D-alanyl-D-alanine carboxypeptidase
MVRVRSEARYGFRCGVVSLAAIVAALTITSEKADARHHRRIYVHYARREVVHVRHHASAEGYSPPSASIVVDGNTSEVLQASNPDALRHPASLTKIMTLYLLFERLDAGKIKLDTPLRVSEHASEQSPTKLGLKPGQTIPVEDAIKGIVTRSANDAAVVIAENLGGDEDDFAKLMTQKAHTLGMSHTTYVNASGLPDDDQITTARDQALLGRAIQERFPRYYKYFSTTSFVFHGETIHGHNHLLGSVDGVDGIKTGFTRASGFNLVTSVHRDGRYIVGVVLGGHSSFERDAHMRELISTHIKEASLRHTAPMIAERDGQEAEPQQVAFAKAPLTTRAAEPAPARTAAPAKTTRAADPTPTATVAAPGTAASNDPIRPLLVKTITYRTAPVQSVALGPMPAMVPALVPAPAAQTAAAQAPVRTPSAPASIEAPHTVVASAEPAAAETIVTDEQTARQDMIRPEPARTEAVRTESAKADMAESEPVDAAPTAPAARSHAHNGWMIQIGAFPDEGDARAHLSAAQTKVHGMLAAADPFTERVQKGDRALYRARFAGFDKDAAEAACRQLKRSDFECMALKD